MASWGIRVSLLAVWLAVALYVTQSAYIDEYSTARSVALSVAAALAVSVVATFLTIMVGIGFMISYRRRKRPIAHIATRVINAASRHSGQPIPARGISSRNGNLAISLEVSEHEFFALGDQINAINTVNRQPLGTLEVVLIEEDYCLCEVVDRMDSSDFWTGLEERMMRSFCPPYLVEFSRYVDETWIDSVSRLVRRWGE